MTHVGQIHTNWWMVFHQSFGPSRLLSLVPCSLFQFLSLGPLKSLAYSLFSSISSSLASALFLIPPKSPVLVFRISPPSSTFLHYSCSRLFRCHSGDLFLYPPLSQVLFFSSPNPSIYLSFPVSSSCDENLSLSLSLNLPISSVLSPSQSLFLNQ